MDERVQVLARSARALETLLVWRAKVETVFAPPTRFVCVSLLDRLACSRPAGRPVGEQRRQQ